MSVSIDRSELVCAVKELNGTGLVPKIKTKNLLEFPLLIAFLEAIESIPEGGPEEDEIPQSVVKYYNRMARKVEAMNSQSIMEFIEKDSATKKKTSKEVEEVIDFVEKKEEVKTKTKLKQIIDVLDGVSDISTKDIFGLKITGKHHPIIKRLAKGKSEGFLVKKDIADKTSIKAAIDMVKKKNPDIVVTKEFIDGKFIYKFFGEKSFWKKTK